jgi:putative sterol carrier protein
VATDLNGETEGETMSDPTEEFFDELGRRKHEPMLRKASGTLRFDLTDGTSEAHWSVGMKKGDLSVSRANDAADCVVATDGSLFDAIVRGEKNAMAAILRGQISIQGDRELLVLFQRVFAGPAASAQRRADVVAGRSS